MAINRRLQLILPLSLIEAINKEVEFLGLKSRLLVVDNIAVESRNDLLRLCVSQLVSLHEAGAIPDLEPLSDETGHLPYFLDCNSERSWGDAIAVGIAGSYSELVSLSLRVYFSRQQATARSLASQLPELKLLLSSPALDSGLTQWRVNPL